MGNGRRTAILIAGWLFLTAARPVTYTVNSTAARYGVQVQDITFESDSLRIRGLLFDPPAPGRRPGVVFNHGGVSGISEDMVRRSADLARAGYMVLTPAYRGEGGSEGRVEVAAGEVNDVLAAAEILRRHPRVDSGRLALVGSSHGALVSVLAASRERKFRAVAAACGVMDVDAWYRYLVANGFDVSDSLSVAVYGRGPEDKPEAFRIRNASLVAARIKAPLLLQQGMKDRIVPPEQAFRMAAAMERARRRNHRVLTYPLLGHAFWFWSDLKHHTQAEIDEAGRAWEDLLHFLAAHLKPGPVPDAAPWAGGEGNDVSDYRAGIEEWHRKRVERLKADDGWLTVAGLFWLHEGENRFGSAPGNDVVFPAGSTPPQAGTFVLEKGRVTVRALPGSGISFGGRPVSEMTLTSDADGAPEVLAMNDLRFFLIQRSKGHAIRMRHLNAPARRNFTAIERYPVDEAWRVETAFVPYDPPKLVEVPNIIGVADTMLAPGYVEFTKDGRTLRLEPVQSSLEADELFFIFKDRTSGTETYPPGRFLYTPLPVDGRVVLDFNRAYNPPCAFTDFATCPLPPPQNELPVAVRAGEKKYGH